MTKPPDPSLHPSSSIPHPSILDVAAAVIQRPDGSFLLAERPAGKPYAGWWEFPGGKIEANEDARAALARELHEELGIDVRRAYPWLTRVYSYPHATVRLYFFRVTAWRGEPHGKENQHFGWQFPGRVEVAPLLPANGPILKALELPSRLAITCATEMGTDLFLQRLDQALAHGLRLIQVREKTLSEEELASLSTEIVRRAAPHGAKVLINGSSAVAKRCGADGVHLSSAQLMSLPQRPDFPWCGASCHDRKELERAAELELDYAVLSPVKATLTHPDAPPLGWDAFADLARGLPLPVYALGGMNAEDMETAWRSGAHGIAMLRSAWRAM